MFLECQPTILDNELRPPRICGPAVPSQGTSPSPASSPSLASSTFIAALLSAFRRTNLLYSSTSLGAAPEFGPNISRNAANSAICRRVSISIISCFFRFAVAFPIPVPMAMDIGCPTAAVWSPAFPAFPKFPRLATSTLSGITGVVCAIAAAAVVCGAGVTVAVDDTRGRFTRRVPFSRFALGGRGSAAATAAIAAAAAIEVGTICPLTDPDPGAADSAASTTPPTASASIVSPAPRGTGVTQLERLNSWVLLNNHSYTAGYTCGPVPLPPFSTLPALLLPSSMPGRLDSDFVRVRCKTRQALSAEPNDTIQ